MFPFNTNRAVRIGEVTFYEKNGITIARKRRNSTGDLSKYAHLRKGACIATSLSTFGRRMPVEYRKVLMSQGGSFPNHFITGITKYNFHNPNLPYLSKQDKITGVEIVAPIQISNGIIPSITDHLEGSTLYTNIFVGGEDRMIETVQELTALLVDDGRFNNSDSLLTVLSVQEQSGSVPRMSFFCAQISLDLFDPTPLLNFSVKGGFVCYDIDAPSDIWAACLVVLTSNLTVSTETLILNDYSLLDKYRTEEKKQSAMNSFKR